MSNVEDAGTPGRDGDEERVFDLGAALDALLGFSPAASYVLLVVDPTAGGIQAYGPYADDAVHDAASAMRDQFRDDDIEGVSVHVLPLHDPDE